MENRIKELKEEIRLLKIEMKRISLLERVNNLKFSDLRYSTHLSKKNNNTYLIHSYEITKNYSHVTKFRVRLYINDTQHKELLEAPNFQQIIVEKYKTRMNKLKK